MGRSGYLRAINDDLIREIVNDPMYDIRTNGTIWTLKTQYGKVGKVWRKAGCYETNGYIQIRYKGKRLLAQRIVYQKYKGRLQSDLVVDHKNKIRDDNRPSNLQLATAKLNRIYMERRKKERDVSKELSS